MTEIKLNKYILDNKIQQINTIAQILQQHDQSVSFIETQCKTANEIAIIHSDIRMLYKTTGQLMLNIANFLEKVKYEFILTDVNFERQLKR